MRTRPKYTNWEIIEKWWEQYKYSNGAFFIHNPEITTKNFNEVLKEKTAVWDLYKISLILSGNYISWVNNFRC